MTTKVKVTLIYTNFNNVYLQYLLLLFVRTIILYNDIYEKILISKDN